MVNNSSVAAPVLQVRNLSKSYTRGRWPSVKLRITAIENINLTVFPRSTLALIGKSGSGKSTLARCLAGLEAPDSGELWFEGKDLLKLGKRQLRRACSGVQLVLQHSAAAMNPVFTAVEVVSEPLRIQRMPKKARYEQAFAMMEKLGIPPEWGSRSPLAFSGGQRQRLVLARALMVKPKLLILDEALAGLDIPIQMQIANLLLDVQAALPVSYLFISHDLQMASHLADVVAVIDHGKIVERGAAEELCSHPQSAQTRELVAAMPKLPKVASGLADSL